MSDASTNRRLLVTGTSGGIGGAVRDAARAQGWTVVELNRADWKDVAAARPLSGPFDAVVFATGTCPVKPLTALTDGELAETFAVNCGLFVGLMRRLVREGQTASTGMKVVAVSSVSAVEGWAGGVAYCASKGALSAVCRALDVELQPRKVSVVAVEPRYVRTRMFEACAGRMGVDPKLAQEPQALAAEILDLIR